jgi:hypothetical protein
VAILLFTIDREAGLICAKHYTNVIDDRGLAARPRNRRSDSRHGGKWNGPLPKLYRLPGKTAKQLCVKIFEEADPVPVTMLDHAAYLGREFVRELKSALVRGEDYVQD